MDRDGPLAAKFVYSLVLVALTVGLALTVHPGEGSPQPNGVERRVVDRARPVIEEGIRRARAEGDPELAARLESILQNLDLREGAHRHNAGCGL
jgi:hypothetical protein